MAIDLRLILKDLVPDSTQSDIISNTGANFSPWTGGAQHTDLPGARWRLGWSYEALQPFEGRTMKAVKAMMRGGAEVLHVRDFSYIARRTVEPGNPRIAGTVERVTVTAGGSGYTTVPTVALTGGGGSGATATAALNGVVQTVTVGAGGSGYTTNPTVALTGGGGSGATAVSVISAGQVVGVTITNPGTGYTSAPAVAFSGGGGSGATATAAILRFVSSVTVTNRGTGYTSNPTVGFTGGGGTGATATASIGQQGAILIIDGLPANTPVYTIGDQVSYLSVDGMYRMHMVTSPVSSDATGRAFVPILPPMRNAPTTGTGVDSLYPSVSVNWTDGGSISVAGIVHSCSFVLTEALYGIL